MAQQCTLQPGDGPAAEFVTTGHAADFGPPHTRVKVGHRDQQALGVILQLHSRPNIHTAPKEDSMHYYLKETNNDNMFHNL